MVRFTITSSKTSRASKLQPGADDQSWSRIIRLCEQGLRRTLAVCLLLIFANTAFASDDEGLSTDDIEIDVPDLAQQPQHSTVIKRVTDTYLRSHYKKFALDDELSSRIFDKLVSSLDPNKRFFLKTDIEQFESARLQFDEAFKRGDLAISYDIFERLLERRKQRFMYALSLLEQPFDFSKAGDKYHYNREDADWPGSVDELDELWRQRVKYDALNLKLADKSSDEVADLLSKRYKRALKRIAQTRSEDVFEAAMNAFSLTLEAHTRYLSPRRSDRFEMDMNLSFEGIGAVLQMQDDYTVVTSVVTGGPADLSKKVKTDDKIVAVAQGDGEFTDVIGWRLDDVVELIKGPKGSTVRLQLIKGGSKGKDISVVALVRDEIKLEERQAKSEVRFSDGDSQELMPIGVISIPSFYNGLHADVFKELEKLKKQEVRGIVVDLRGNTGGSLSESILLTGLFIEQGPVVQVRMGSGQVRDNDDKDGVAHYQGPLTVLVDRYSASASEIFAAAIQDYQRGLVVGEQTFGKGTVQQHRSLGRVYDMFDQSLGSIQFTIAKFYRINGGSTQHVGVIPDISYPTAVDPSDWGESKEENALPWDQIEPDEYKVFDMSYAQTDVLVKNMQSRTSEHPEFVYLREDIERFKQRQERSYISLVEQERLAERDQDRERRLARTNERLTRFGLEPVESIDQLPDDIPELEALDPFLQETVNITGDIIKNELHAFAYKMD